MPNPSRRIVFAGTPDFALPVLEAVASRCRAGDHRLVAVYTRPDRPAGRGRKLRPSPVKCYAERCGLALEQPEIFDAAAERRLAARRPDLLVTMAYGLLLPASTLAIPTLACINVHTSLLPRWRGAAPVARAIEAGDTQSGISLMRMTEELDAGPIISRHACPVAAEDTTATLSHKLGASGARALAEFLDRLDADGVSARPQERAGVCYAPKLSKREAWLAWDNPGAVVARTVRALNPWPVAQGRLEGKVLRIWRAVACAGAGAPGQVLAADADGIVVACGAGALRLLSVQLAGGKVMSGAAFANGHRVVGRRFGAPPAGAA